MFRLRVWSKAAFMKINSSKFRLRFALHWKQGRVDCLRVSFWGSKVRIKTWNTNGWIIVKWCMSRSTWKGILVEVCRKIGRWACHCWICRWSWYREIRVGISLKLRWSILKTSVESEQSLKSFRIFTWFLSKSQN